MSTKIAISQKRAFFKLWELGLLTEENMKKAIKEVPQPTKGYFYPDDFTKFIKSLTESK